MIKSNKVFLVNNNSNLNKLFILIHSNKKQKLFIKKKLNLLYHLRNKLKIKNILLDLILQLGIFYPYTHSWEPKI